MFPRRNRAEREKAKIHDQVEGEAACLFVGSKGLMKLCETHQPLPNDTAQKWPRRALKSHLPGGRIYVHAPALAHFVRRVLPKIRCRFVLVSGDSVTDVSPAALGDRVVEKVLDHPDLVHWYAQNLGFDHPKVSPMPLGMDYHSMALGRRVDWGPSASPKAQEDLLHSIRAAAVPLRERRIQGYCNWHFTLANGDRSEVLESLPSASCYFEPARVARAESWRRNTEYLFTISPRGRGMDCHRTWEALSLGSVPLIPDLPINRLFESLPVVVVKDWASVTPEFLAAERERILNQEFDFAPLLLETWRRRLSGRGDVPVLRMRYQEFIAMRPAELERRATEPGAVPKVGTDCK